MILASTYWHVFQWTKIRKSRNLTILHKPYSYKFWKVDQHGFPKQKNDIIWILASVDFGP